MNNKHEAEYLQSFNSEQSGLEEMESHDLVVTRGEEVFYYYFIYQYYYIKDKLIECYYSIIII